MAKQQNNKLTRKQAKELVRQAKAIHNALAYLKRGGEDEAVKLNRIYQINERMGNTLDAPVREILGNIVHHEMSVEAGIAALEAEMARIDATFNAANATPLDRREALFQEAYARFGESPEAIVKMYEQDERWADRWDASNAEMREQ